MQGTWRAPEEQMHTLLRVQKSGKYFVLDPCPEASISSWPAAGLPIKLFTYFFLYIHCEKPNIPEQLCSYNHLIWRHSLDAPARHIPVSRQQHLGPGIVWDDHHPNCPTHPTWNPCSTTSYYSLLATAFCKQPGCSTHVCHSFSALAVTHIQRWWLQILRCQGSRGPWSD